MDRIKVEVAYATPEKQRIIEVEVPRGASATEAVRLSGIEREFPDQDMAGAPLGIFGRKLAKPDEQPLEPGDRVEIYRPLLIDPKQARRNRAKR